MLRPSYKNVCGPWAGQRLGTSRMVVTNFITGSQARISCLATYIQVSDNMDDDWRSGRRAAFTFSRQTVMITMCKTMSEYRRRSSHDEPFIPTSVMRWNLSRSFCGRMEHPVYVGLCHTVIWHMNPFLHRQTPLALWLNRNVRKTSTRVYHIRHMVRRCVHAILAATPTRIC